MELRAATRLDLPAIDDIYNHYVVHSTCTYQLEIEPFAERERWFDAHDSLHPVIVATESAAIVGWASLSQFHARAGYQHTVENSVYVDHRQHRRGIGRALMTEIIARAKSLGHHSIVAGISSDQEASIALHASFGFTKVAHLREVGHKFGRWLDVVQMQRML